MYKNLTPEEIAGLAMFNYIITNSIEEEILDKMNAVNLLESVSYETHDNNEIEETYTRELFLRGRRISSSVKKYTYNEDETPKITLGKVEHATLEDLKEFLMNSDYQELLIIAKEVGYIETNRNNQTKLSLKK